MGSSRHGNEILNRTFFPRPPSHAQIDEGPSPSPGPGDVRQQLAGAGGFVRTYLKASADSKAHPAP